MLTLVYSRMNCAWLYMWAGQPLRMSGEDLFFNTRPLAECAAARHGLYVVCKPGTRAGYVVESVNAEPEVDALVTNC
jgi:hypothetical protein